MPPTYARARVAITPAFSTLPDACCENIHVGHARALLLGSLIAQELGIPFHVRFDGGYSYISGDRGATILDTVNCLRFLHIDYDSMYWVPQVLPTKNMLSAKLGPERAEVLWACLVAPQLGPEPYKCQIMDDLFDYDPSLIVRGSEFGSDAHQFFGPALEASAAHALTENVLYNAAGREKHEINTPMVMIGQAKMSKTSMRLVHWTALTAAHWEDARAFLIATALCPTAPLEALGDPFKISAMSDTPYVWSWKDWAVIARCE